MNIDSKFDYNNDDFKFEIKNSWLKIVNEYYNYQEQQTMIVNLKSQLIQLEKENNKLRHSSEDLNDQNENLTKRIGEIEVVLDDLRRENEKEAKVIAYESEQRKIMDSYESLIKSKDITIKSYQDKLLKVDQRTKQRINLKSKFVEDGLVLLKVKQQLLVEEIIKNVESSLIQWTTDSNTNLPVGKISITNILYHLNNNLFSKWFKDIDIIYKELHPLSNEIFTLFMENKFPNSYQDSDVTPNGGKKRSSYAFLFKSDIDEISISVSEGEDLKIDFKDQLKILSILYSIIFSHFIEAQMKVRSNKDTISILEEKIQVLKDSIKSEISIKTSLQSELKATKEFAQSTKKQIEIKAIKTIQKHWRKHISNIKSKKILMERIKRLKEIQQNEKIRKSMLGNRRQKSSNLSSTSKPQIQEEWK